MTPAVAESLRLQFEDTTCEVEDAEDAEDGAATLELLRLEPQPRGVLLDAVDRTSKRLAVRVAIKYHHMASCTAFV